MENDCPEAWCKSTEYVENNLGSVFSLPICENANKKGVSVNYVGIFHI